MKEGKEGTVKEEGVAVGQLEAEMRPKRKMKMWVLADTREMRVSTTPVIKTLGIKEEEVEDVEKDQEEEASMVPIFIAMKKVIMHLNALNGKEGHIGELMVMQGLLMWMKMYSHHILRMQKEERFS